MGLDNGIVLKASSIKNEQVKKMLAPYILEYSPDVMEFAYWRKCWGIRADILNVLDTSEYPGNDGDFVLDIDLINEIIKILKSYNRKNWAACDSIWEWEEIRDRLKIQIKDLKVLIKALTIEPELAPYFYDSY